MSAASASTIAPYAHAVAFVAYGWLATHLTFAGRLSTADLRSRRPWLAALWVSAAWAAVALWAEIWPFDHMEAVSSALDLLRYGLWFAFLLALFAETNGRSGPQASQAPRLAALVCMALATALLLIRLIQGAEGPSSKPEIAAMLALAVCGLLLVEQLFRNLGEEARWNAKPVCLGLACIFGFDLYLNSEGLLFSHFDPDAVGMRSAVHALSVPFLFVGARRGSNWMVRLQVSRAAAFYSATLILAGGYLLFMAAIGYYVRYFGGSWGGALQIGLLVASLALLGMLVFSSSLRSWLRVFVGKHFFSYRYDYREEWLRFTAMLSSKRTPQEMGELIVRGLAKMVECPAGSLWTRHGPDAAFAQTAQWNTAPARETEPTDSALCRFLGEQGWVIDLEEFRDSPRRYEALALPNWLLATPNAWLVVPLLVGDELLGFVVLSRPLTTIKINWEVLDLLKTAGRQAAGYLAQMQATEALLEARKFEAFNRMSAFVVHDLKNIMAQLSLMLKNAERLHDNAEFQQDMLLTVSSSLEKMKRMMLQLREGATPPGGSRGVELMSIVQRLQVMAKGQGRVLEVDVPDRLSTRGHDDRLERVLGHLVQNALDATPPSGRVWVRTSRYSGQVRVEVGDTGAGMTDEFVHTKLFRPFNSTKHSGMGIGTYESAQYIRELGGSLAVESEPGQGTLITVMLPLFETQHESDLMKLGSA